MKPYIAQKADQALEAMCGRESLTERLQKAQTHFIFISDNHHLDTTPEHVRENITAFLKCKTGRGSMRSAALAHSAIASALIEFGRSTALQSSIKRKNGKKF